MTAEHPVLAVIPARGGSKRLPGKNLRVLAGRPLLQWSITTARDLPFIDRLIVNTDAEEIAACATAAGAEVPFLRPAELATDTTSTLEVVLHTLDWYAQRGENFEYVMLLQPTSPLRRREQLIAAWDRLNARQADAVVSVCECEHPPLWSNTLPPDGDMTGFLPRDVLNRRSQDLPTCYRLNGAIYLIRAAALRQARSFFLTERQFALIMPAEDSVDIDNEIDFLLADCLMRKRLANERL